VERRGGRAVQIDRAVRREQQAGRSGNVADRAAVALQAHINDRRGVSNADACPDEESLSA